VVSIPWAVCGEWNAPKEPLERSIAVLVTEIVQPRTLGAIPKNTEQFIHYPLYFSTLLCSQNAAVIGLTFKKRGDSS